MKQWFFKITDYADRLLADVDSLDWPEKIKTMQKNWIGKSVGSEVVFQVADCTRQIKVFTTRIDTIFGATFLVLAPEHPLALELATEDRKAEVAEYIKNAIKKSEIERQENKEKTGVFTGAYAIHPLTGNQIPIYIADYVLIGYGEGAVMAVPAHDERDQAFAEKYGLEVKTVIDENEILINSDDYTGLTSEEAKAKITKDLEKDQIAAPRTTYRMRDWLISRQRYWGCPIPIAYDKDGNPHAIPEDQLPVVLPDITDYKPDSSGRSALAKAEDWKKVIINGEEMTRETDTLDGYACSSWYLWRYTSPHDKEHAWDQEAVKYWAPTDIYVGGDHAVAHLLYVRFWAMFFHDLGLLPFEEPVKTLLYNGYINAPDGKKMSKSKGNVIDPLDVIDSGYGADTLRTYELFIGPYNEDAAWSTKAIGGVYRFLNRCFNLVYLENTTAKVDDEANLMARHKTIKKATDDMNRANFNTVVAALMEFVNHLYKNGAAQADLVVLAKLLYPFAPHLASEILEALEADFTWPTYDESALVSETAEYIIQVNGKVRAKLQLSTDLSQEELQKLALADENVKKYLNGEPRKIIFPPNTRLVSIVA